MRLIKNRGFTLVEMVVVIAIIGILAAAVLTALSPSRDKAKDTRITSALNQVRAIAETKYEGSTGKYIIPEGVISQDDDDFGDSAEDIATQNGVLNINLEIGDYAGQSFRAWSILNGGGYYCVSSSGVSKKFEGTAPNDVVNSPASCEP